MTSTGARLDSFNEYLTVLEEAIRRSLGNKTKTWKSMLEDTNVHAEIKNEYQVLKHIDASLWNGKVLTPNEFAGLLQMVTRVNTIDNLVKPYEKVYSHGWHGFARSAMITVESAIADDLSVVLPAQLKLVLSGVVPSYLSRNPDSKAYVLAKLKELESSDHHIGFEKAMLSLGVPGDIANLLANAIWSVVSHFSSKDAYLDRYILSLNNALDEVKHLVNKKVFP